LTQPTVVAEDTGKTQPPTVAENAESHAVGNETRCPTQTVVDNKKSVEAPTTRVCMRRTNLLRENIK
jgi:hypothetical protein